MKVCHVTGLDDRWAGTRYRALIPGGVLVKQGWEVYTDARPMPDAVNVYHKHFYSHLPSLSQCPGILDITDDHFAHAIKGPRYRRMCEMATRVTCCTPVLAERIRVETGVGATVIIDPYEFPEVEFRWQGGRSVMWYGHAYNMSALQGIHLDCPMEAITECEPGVHGSVTYTPYSHGAMVRGFERHDVVLCIALQTEQARSKSPNRLVNALRAGKFVIANEHPAHKEFKPFVWMGDALEGLSWARDNVDDVRDMATAGQAHIRDRYSPEAAAAQWQEVLTSA